MASPQRVRAFVRGLVALVIMLPVLCMAAGLSEPRLVVVAQNDAATTTVPVSKKADARPILRVATGEWSPYVSVNYPHHGALAHIITTIYDEAGIDVEYAYFPWPRGYQMVRDGIWHATMPYYCSPEREVDFYCSEPIANGQQVLFYHIERPVSWEKFEDLKGLNIGATLGYYYGETFEKYEKNGWIHVQRVARDDSNFKVLMKGRIQAFPQDLAVGYSMIRQIFTPDEQKLLTHHPKTLHTNPLHLIFPRNNLESEERLVIFNKGLKLMKSDGRFDRFMKAMQDGDYESGAIH